jgi:hypothetical protein
MSRQPLTVGPGQILYVEPMATSTAGAVTLLAGSPTFLWGTTASGQYRLEGRDTVFGALITGAGTGRMIPSPIPASRIGLVRAVPTGNATWGVIFAEMTPEYHFPNRGTIAHLWFATLSPRGWSPLTELPATLNEAINPSHSSELQYRHGNFAWAVRTDSSRTSSVAVFERNNGVWTYERLPVDDAAYVEFTGWTDNEMEIAIVRAFAEPGTHDSNSLFLHRRGEAWDTGRRIVRGGEEPVYEPAPLETPRGKIITWWSRVGHGGGMSFPARTSLAREGQPVVMLDSSVSQAFSLGLLPRREPVWVLNHRMPDSDGELRIIRLVLGKPVVIARTPNPFKGPFSATVLDQSTIAVAGPLLSEDRGGSLSTLVIRFRLRCDSAR